MTHDIIGVDIAKDWIDIHTLSSGQGKRLAASRSALARFAARVGDVLVVMEASGGYERPLMEALAEAGVAFARVNPRQAREFARATGRRAVASLAGLAPHACDSGVFRGKRRVWGGRAEVRRSLLSGRLHRKPIRPAPQGIPHPPRGRRKTRQSRRRQKAPHNPQCKGPRRQRLQISVTLRKTGATLAVIAHSTSDKYLRKSSLKLATPTFRPGITSLGRNGLDSLRRKP